MRKEPALNAFIATPRREAKEKEPRIDGADAMPRHIDDSVEREQNHPNQGGEPETLRRSFRQRKDAARKDRGQ